MNRLLSPDHLQMPAAMPSGLAELPGEAEPLPYRSATGPRVGIELLYAAPLLRGLAPDLAHWLALCASLRRFQRQALVIEQGSAQQALYIVVSGEVQTSRQGPRGRSVVIDRLGPGAHFGDLSLIDGQPQSASVRCRMNSELLVIPQRDFLLCLARSTALLQSLTAALARRLRERNQRIAQLALNDVRGCVLQQLQTLSEEHEGRRLVRAPIGRKALAEMIGASREMVSRVMMELSREGLIEIRADGSTLLHQDTTAAA